MRNQWGKNNHAWKGGKYIKKKYLLIKKRDHPNCDNDGYVPEHRLKMEKKIGRFLRKDEIVHHKDGNTLNNRITNLQLFTWGEHTAHHNKGRKYSDETKKKMKLKALGRKASKEAKLNMSLAQKNRWKKTT